MTNISSIIIDCFILTFASIGFIISFGIIFLIIYNQHQYPINSSIILISNTYISIIYICFFLLNTYSYNLYGDIHENISFNNWWCYIRSYFLHCGLATLYHSFLLQSIFRFFRIVFYKYKQLQNFQFIFTFIIIQWLMDFILMLPVLFLKHFVYIPQYYYCQISYTNLHGVIYPALIVYYIPMLMIGIIYFYIIYYMKKTRNVRIHQNRLRTNQRDLIILRRIIILILILFILSFPSVILWVSYVITGYLYPLIYHFQWLTYVFSLSILSILSVYLTPQLRKLLVDALQRNRHIQSARITCEYELNGKIIEH